MSRHEIQVLRAAGLAQVAVAAWTGTSERSVRRIDGEAPVTTADTGALIETRRVGRPTVAGPWTTVIAKWLEQDRDLPSGEIMRRLREEHHYAGGKSAVYELARRLRPTPLAPMVRFEGARRSSASTTSATSMSGTRRDASSARTSSPVA